MKIIVVYSSTTGFTKRYAKWIAEKLGCKAVEWNKEITQKLDEYDRIIYGGSLMANRILNLDKMKAVDHKKLIVFAVGFSEKSSSLESELSKQNQIEDLPFFYYRGGVKLEALNFFKKMLIKKITGVSESVDFTQEDNIQDLIQLCEEKTTI